MRNRTIESCAFLLLAAVMIIAACASGPNWFLVAREQQQLFTFDLNYAADLMWSVGGLTSLIARFIVQFFHSPTIASIAISILAFLTVLPAWLPFRRQDKAASAFPLCASLAVSVMVMSNLLPLHFDAVIAFLLSALALCAYSGISRHRSATGIFIIAALYLAAGPSAFLFALSASAYDLLGEGGKGSIITAVLFPAVALMLCLASLFFGVVPTAATAIGPAFYCEPTAKLPAYIQAAWYSLPLVVLLVGAIPKIIHSKIIGITVATIFSFALAIALTTLSGYGKRSPQANICQYEYLCGNERWDELEKASRPHMYQYVDANYHNLALAQQGKLAETLFKYPQHTSQSIIFLMKSEQSNPVAAHVLFAMGNVAAAQNIAFNSMQSFCGYCPEMMKIVTMTDIMRGSYNTAEKYLDMLEKAPHYRAWARKYKTFLYDDKAVENDPVLGNGRKNLQCSEGFVIDPNPMDDLNRILEVNQSDAKAMEYGLSFLLLEKDITNVQKFIDRHYGTAAMPELPTPAQEALLFFSDYSINVLGDDSVDRQYCLNHGVTQSTISLFERFQQETLDNSGAAPQSFRNTYWYYMLYE